MATRTPASALGRSSRIATLALALAALGLSACGPQSRGTPAPVVNKGTSPEETLRKTGPNTLNNEIVAQPDSNGIVTYDGYQSVVARNGDTVAQVADRVGLSASELGAYNGLSANFALEQGQELVLPPRPGGYGPNGPRAAVTAPATTAPVATAAVPTTIEQTSLDETPAPDAAETTELAAAAPAAEVANDSGWSPDLAAAAIDRSTGLQDDGTLAAPPSATAPTPPAPVGREELSSPNLGQYQTEASTTANAPLPRPESGATAAGTPAGPVETDPSVSAVAAAAPAADPAPAAAAPGLRLVRPVSGPVAIGFNKGAGPARNDGVDFAAKAGSPVVAAADGEVALVSQSLSGLGTIVLVRHPDEYLTVYGRIDGVTVNKGDAVRRGQKIGVVSNAAAPAEPRMHFEVRRGAESLDPMTFLSS